MHALPDRLRFVSLAVAICALGCDGYYGRGYGRGGDYGGHGTTGGGPTVSQGPHAGSVCDPSAAIDQCASANLTCTPLLVDGGFTCQAPGEFYQCDGATGCAAGLSCLSGYCLQACGTTADCVDPLTVCAPYGSAGNQCLLNECEGQEGFGLWQSCSAASADGGDGTCVPLEAYAGNSGCQQAGAVALGGACQFDRADGGPGFCAVGLICMVDAAGDNRGICMEVCNAFGSQGPTCPGGTSCVATTLPFPPPAVSALDYYSDTGACAQTCTPVESVDAGTDPGDGGASDAGVDDGGAGDGGALDGGVASDAGADAGAGSDGGCPSPTTCLNGSITSTPDNVCLP
jgi:hypothetical protein